MMVGFIFYKMLYEFSIAGILGITSSKSIVFIQAV